MQFHAPCIGTKNEKKNKKKSQFVSSCLIAELHEWEEPVYLLPDDTLIQMFCLCRENEVKTGNVNRISK